MTGSAHRFFPPAYVREGLERKASARAALCLNIAIADVSSLQDACVDHDADRIAEDSAWLQEIMVLVECDQAACEPLFA